MALFRTVGGRQEQLSPADEAATLAEWGESDARANLNLVKQKRGRLIAYERSVAIDSMIASQRSSINSMDDAALDAALDSRGLTF